jgi:RHS repeat-associated protein
MRLDAETGLYYDRARFYSSSLGRFLQTDPVGYAADLNLYAYVGNDPTDKTDPSGNCAEDACVVEGGVAISAGTVYVVTGGLVAAGVCIAACGYIHDQIGNAASNVWNHIVHNDAAKPPAKPQDGQKPPRNLPIKGKPGDVATKPNKDGTPGQTREYGDDGYPTRDVDRGHDHGAGDPHVHDWTRPSDGSPPTSQDRQPGREPKPGEVEGIEKKCVPKPGGTSC